MINGTSWHIYLSIAFIAINRKKVQISNWPQISCIMIVLVSKVDKFPSNHYRLD